MKKLPLINSDNKKTRIAGYILYAWLGLFLLGVILPNSPEASMDSNSVDSSPQDPQSSDREDTTSSKNKECKNFDELSDLTASTLKDLAGLKEVEIKKRGDTLLILSTLEEYATDTESILPLHISAVRTMLEMSPCIEDDFDNVEFRISTLDPPNSVVSKYPFKAVIDQTEDKSIVSTVERWM